MPADHSPTFVEFESPSGTGILPAFWRIELPSGTCKSRAFRDRRATDSRQIILARAASLLKHGTYLKSRSINSGLAHDSCRMVTYLLKCIRRSAPQPMLKQCNVQPNTTLPFRGLQGRRKTKLAEYLGHNFWPDPTMKKERSAISSQTVLSRTASLSMGHAHLVKSKHEAN